MKKEKILIFVLTVIILAVVFVCFLASNSQKTPPELFAQNESGQSATAILGTYTWKVFGNEIISDSAFPLDFDYSISNTLVTKTKEMITVSSEDKFTVSEMSFYKNIDESYSVSPKLNEVANYLTFYAPEVEGIYYCIFEAEFYGKGEATYAFKVVVTDENIYDVNSIIKYKDTEVFDISKINEIIKKLPYGNNHIGTMISASSTANEAIIKYNEAQIEEQDLLNNSIALFALIPKLELISYESNDDNQNIVYSRDEINGKILRDVLDYANDSELWIREVIFKEKVFSLDKAEMFSQIVLNILSNYTDKEIGDYIAVYVKETNESGDISEVLYNKKSFYKALSKEYPNVVSIYDLDSNVLNSTLVEISLSEDTSEELDYIASVNVNLLNLVKENFKYGVKVVNGKYEMNVLESE